jgi:hypothetical protein
MLWRCIFNVDHLKSDAPFRQAKGFVYTSLMLRPLTSLPENLSLGEWGICFPDLRHASSQGWE